MHPEEAGKPTTKVCNVYAQDKDAEIYWILSRLGGGDFVGK